ncbi:hypothetical protein [Arenibaculum sp.]|uniref:hypothetical protein n=1 Tax=Arenibaculum sp. TaxID=2865862 RepID=UPI002E0E6B1D|nr:hypothetical protein [Arenibaculum sp.]
MTDEDFLWPVAAPEAEGLRVAAEIGFVEGTDFIRKGGEFRFPTTEKAMLFNRSLVDAPGTEGV